jgi:hypothetical protein
LLAGALLFAVEWTAVAFPSRFQSTLPFAGGVYQVTIPWTVCAAIAVYAWAMRGWALTSKEESSSRAVAAGIATHLVLLLAGYTDYLNLTAAFTAPVYMMYARAFCALVLAALTFWIAASASDRSTVVDDWRARMLPVSLATIVYAAALLRVQPVSALAGLLAGALVTAISRHGRSAVTLRGGRLLQSDRWFLFATCVVAVALRLFYTARVMTNPDYIETGGDGAFYERIATAISEGRGTNLGGSYPLYLLGYPRFISWIYLVAGHRYFVVCAVQAVLGALTCVLIYAIARPIFGRAVANLAAAFTAVSFQLVFTAATYSHEAVDLFLTPLTVWLLMRAVERPPQVPPPQERLPWPMWIIIGLIFGAGVAVRETNAIFLLFVLAWLPFASRGSNRIRRAVRPALLLAAGVAIVVLPLFVPKVATAAERAQLRGHLDRLWVNPIQPDMTKSRTLVSPFTHPSEALAQFRQTPIPVVGAVAYGMTTNFAAQFFSQPTYGAFDLVALTKYSAYYDGVWFWAYVLTAVGFFVSMGRWLRGDPHAVTIALIIGVLVSRTAPHLILESHYRHRAPIEMFLIMLCAVGVVRLVGGPRAISGDNVTRRRAA